MPATGSRTSSSRTSVSGRRSPPPPLPPRTAATVAEPAAAPAATVLVVVVVRAVVPVVAIVAVALVAAGCARCGRCGCPGCARRSAVLVAVPAARPGGPRSPLAPAVLALVGAAAVVRASRPACRRPLVIALLGVRAARGAAGTAAAVAVPAAARVAVTVALLGGRVGLGRLAVARSAVPAGRPAWPAPTRCPAATSRNPPSSPARGRRDEPPCRSLIAAIRSPLRIPAVPVMPICPASSRSSASTMPVRPARRLVVPPFVLVRGVASASAAGAAVQRCHWRIRYPADQCCSLMSFLTRSPPPVVDP